MKRSRVVFFLFVIFIAAAAVVFTATSAPAPPGQPQFSTPTLTSTATNTPESSPTIALVSTGDLNADSPTNCTYPLEAWREYPEAWGLALIRLGNQTYARPEIEEILARPGSDLHTLLLKQLFTAVINQRAGADPNDIIETLAAAADWLAQHPANSELAAADQTAGQQYVERLTAYNLGEIGPGACVRPIETPLPSHTPTPQDSPTPTISPTPLVSPTNTRAPASGGGPIYRSPTPSPTEEEEDRPPPPTWTPVPPPTDTPVPPTPVPQDTPTPAPFETTPAP